MMASITVVHPRVLVDNDLKEMVQRRNEAMQVVFKMCSGEQRFHMSIPVHGNDSDIVLCNALQDSERMMQEVYRIRGEIKVMLAEETDMPDEYRSKLMAIIFDGN